MTKPRAGQSGNWDRERADRLQEDVERMQKDVERLERWKAEATEVMSGLRELGKALGLGLGVQITGPAALAEVARLTAERDALAQIKRHIDEVRNGTGWTVQIYGVLLQQCDQYGKTIDTRRAEWAEAERDALAARVAQVESLADHWAKRAASDYEAGGTLTWGAADVHFSAVLREALAEPIGQEVDLPLHRTEAGSALDTMGADQ